tara:strand:- start:5173 stop:5286 length:114 start_codon:yes stop_codon:yes gene_type:complete
MKKKYKTPDLILGYLKKKDLKILYINPPFQNDLQAKT